MLLQALKKEMEIEVGEKVDKVTEGGGSKVRDVGKKGRTNHEGKLKPPRP